MVYIRQTRRTLQYHVKEHLRAVKLMDTNLSAIAEHAIKRIMKLIGKLQK